MYEALQYAAAVLFIVVFVVVPMLAVFEEPGE
jgi:hypothetical protein